MTEHNPIKPPKPEGGEEEKSSLLERASGAFGLSNLGAAPMPRSFDDVPMKRARPLRKNTVESAPVAPPPASPPDPETISIEGSAPEASLPIPARPAAPPPAVIEGNANAIALSGEPIEVDFARLRERGYIDPSGQASGLAEEFPVSDRQPDVEEVKRRLLYVQALETVRCLEENVLTHPADGDLGGTMRLGAYDAELQPGSRISEIYGGATVVSERHRHRYEVNNAYREQLEKDGLVFSGMSPDGLLPEIVERPDHPWFVGVQSHPELKSRPFAPHPLFAGFVAAALRQSRLV